MDRPTWCKECDWLSGLQSSLPRGRDLGLEAETGFWQNLHPAVHWPGPGVGSRGCLATCRKGLPGLKAEIPMGFLSGGGPRVLGELGEDSG